MDFLGQQQWILIAVVFFGIIGYIVWMRWRDRKWIDERFGSRTILAMSFGVNFFGRASEPGQPGQKNRTGNPGKPHRPDLSRPPPQRRQPAPIAGKN